MFSRESRRTRRNGNDRRRPCLATLESLERRELLAYSTLGSSLPDLSITGFASPVASWGGPVTVTFDVKNIGASSTIEPLALSPGSTSSADAGPFRVAVYASKSPRSLNGSVLVGTVDLSGQAQNSDVQTTTTLAMPQQPFKFPGNGGKIYLFFQVNSNGAVLESDTSNNLTKAIPLTIEAPLPELATVGLDLPPTIQPGDTVQPNIRIANLGPADTLPQGPVTIALVASTTPTFNQGSTIVATYSINNIPGESQVATQGSIFGDANLIPQRNVVTIAGSPVTLPTSPRIYYLGVVIDPTNQIKQLQRVPQFTKPSNVFTLPHKIGPPITFLPPAGVLVAGGVSNVPQFPLPFGANPVGGTNAGLFPAPFPPPLLLNSVGFNATGSPSRTGGFAAAGVSSGSSFKLKTFLHGIRGRTSQPSGMIGTISTGNGAKGLSKHGLMG